MSIVDIFGDLSYRFLELAFECVSRGKDDGNSKKM